MTKLTQVLIYERETKNTVVFKAPKGSAVDTLYITKEAIRTFGASPPASVSITIEPVADKLEQIRSAVTSYGEY